MTFQSPAPSRGNDRGDYGFARARDLAFDAVSSLWRIRSAQGMKKTDIAAYLGRDPAWVNRALKGPANWTMRTFGELVEAMDGEAEIIVHDLQGSHLSSTNYDAYSDYDSSTGNGMPFFVQSNPVPTLGLFPNIKNSFLVTK